MCFILFRKLCGYWSKTNTNQTISSETGFSDPTRSDKTHCDDLAQSNTTHLNDPSCSNVMHFNDQTPPIKTQVDDPTSSDKTHLDDPSPSDKTHFDDPSPPDKTHLDDPTPSDKTHLDEPTPSNKEHLDERSLSDKTHSDDPIPPNKAHFDDPSPFDKIYLDDPTPSNKAHLNEPTSSDKIPSDDPIPPNKAHFGDPSPSDKTHLDDPTPSNKAHLDEPTSSDKIRSDDPIPPNKAHFDNMSPSDKTHLDDPTPSNKTHLDEPTSLDKTPSHDPSPSNKAHLDEPTSSDKTPSEDPIPPNKAHFDDPTTTDKTHLDEPNRMSAPLEIPLKEIEAVTNNFDEKNFIGEGFIGKIYKGQLPLEGELVDVTVRRSDHSFWLQDLAFDKEISILTLHKHENMVSNVGFCNENDEMLIINKRVARGSLRRHLNRPTLTWMRRLKISVGVVRALSYLHNGVGPNFTVIHHNINSNTILLDENWEAKISGFEYSMRIPAGNLDLAYEKLGIGTYKSDVFSMGIVLFELLCGRDTFASKEDNSFQASSAIFHYENRELHKFVDPDLFSQMDQLSFNIFSKTAYNCLVHQRAPPTMNEILKRLERALKVQQMYENNEQYSTVPLRKVPEHLKLKLESLNHMRIPLNDILTATGNFAKGHIVSSGGFGSVYTAELEHVDRESLLAVENEREVPKMRSTVAIKNIEDTEDEVSEQGFYAEIEMLTSCKHSNIITLVGFCDERGAMILIYEYASNGNLSYYLQNIDKHNDGWAQRLKICIDAAKGLSFLHTTDGDRQEIVHRDIKSGNILLDENLEAKIGDFGLSIFPSVSKEHYIATYRNVVGTLVYMDPQYRKDAKLKIKSDVYSFGVVLFEILCGTVAYHRKYINKGLALVGREHFVNKTIMKMVDSKIKEEITKSLFTSVIGPNQESLDTFTKIAYKCLAEAQDNRPTMANVVKELQKALHQEETRIEILQISPNDTKLALDEGANHKYWTKYTGKVSSDNGNTITVTVKYHKERGKYKIDLEVGRKYRHENVIRLLGFYEEEEKRVIVYEHALNGSLKEHLNNPQLTWSKRLKICIDIATGLDFLHGGLVTGEVVVHNNTESSNILLDADMNAKLDGFGHARILDPTDARYSSTFLKYDIFLFGIVLFEVMLQGSVSSFETENRDYFDFLIQGLYKKGRLDELVYESKNAYIAPQSLVIYRRIAIQCLHDDKMERPTAGEMLIQLKQALDIQEKAMDTVRISFEDIKHATDNFSDENCLGRGARGKVYKGQHPRANEHKTIVAKCWDVEYSQRDSEFNQELEILFKFTHTNVVGLEGYCNEMGEKIIVYEYVPNGSLDRWLNNTSLTWKKRLAICVDVATGLAFLHGDVLRREGVLHRNINSSNILLSGDWKAKITSFGLSLIRPNNPKFGKAVIKEPGISKSDDIYSFGVVLFETLCGQLARPSNADNQQYLIPLAKNYYENNKLDQLVFEGIKEKHIVPESLSTFANIAYKCLDDDPHMRPKASDVQEQLKKALELQADWENWDSKLPSDYKEIFQQSRTPEICDTEKKEVLYKMLSEGIFIEKDKVWFWLDSCNNKNKMISATVFTYQNQSSRRWRRVRKSRFERVSLIVDISNLKIKIPIKTRFLTLGVQYGVFLVFKFGEPKKTSSKPMYVNLKYKKENETLHAYFASWRDDNWMMIELYRFRNDEDACDFELLLESFSRYYCRSGDVYFEGVEFRALYDVQMQHFPPGNVESAKVKRESTSFLPQMMRILRISDHEDGTTLSEINGKKRYVFSAKEALKDSSNMKLFKVKPSEQCRFGEVIEVLSQQVFQIKCWLRSKYLSPDTNYRCYLIFKLSEKCRGLHCPVKVRDLIHRSNKGIKALYFRSPHAWNIHDINHVPKERGDGWMEVNLVMFNEQDVSSNGLIFMDLKLISYEGTMSGLIICGFEFRPV